MKDIFRTATEAVQILNRSGVDYALCGGLAVGVHGHIRATGDVDVVVRDNHSASTAASLFGEAGWIVNPTPISFPDGFTLHRVLHPQGTTAVPLDILVPPPGWDVLAGKEIGEIDHCMCWVVSKEQLLRMKRSAGRKKDLIDIMAIEEGDGDAPA